MLFNSLSFAAFLPIVFILYWFGCRGNLKRQNLLLLLASYYFYSCWDYRFLFLLIFSTLLDFFTGLKISETNSPERKKFWLWLSIIVNLGFLAVFKYYNFFISSFVEGLSYFGLSPNVVTLSVILPVGISFYTFHGLSYVIDIYYGRIEVEKNFLDYAVFVSFFPLLVAGPIERASHLLPKIKRQRHFDYNQGVDGLKQILWGLFKKVVIADNCAQYSDLMFNNHESYGGSTLVFGAFMFALQIYGDFSGYSDIALGTARLFGIELLRNFAYPYFSRDIAEFWRRWHISLSSWFRDYVYIPLGGSRGGKWGAIRNTIFVFLLSGLWHGANWTFLIWGGLNAIFFLPLLLTGTNRQNLNIVAENAVLPTFKEAVQMLTTFGLVLFGWIFFRAESVNHALEYITGIFSPSLFSIPVFFGMGKALTTLLLIVLLMVVEWIGRHDDYAIKKMFSGRNRIVRWSWYSFICFLIGIFMQTIETPFIYFQF